MIDIIKMYYGKLGLIFFNKTIPTYQQQAIAKGLGRKLLQSGHHYLVPKTSLHLPATSQSTCHGWINSIIDFEHKDNITIVESEFQKHRLI